MAYDLQALSKASEESHEAEINTQKRAARAHMEVASGGIPRLEKSLLTQLLDAEVEARKQTLSAAQREQDVANAVLDAAQAEHAVLVVEEQVAIKARRHYEELVKEEECRLVAEAEAAKAKVGFHVFVSLAVTENNEIVHSSHSVLCLSETEGFE